MDFDQELDTRGLSCPLPVLKTKKSLSTMRSGQVLRIISTDHGSIKDMQTYSRQTGNELLSSTVENGEYVFFMKRR